MFQIIEWVNAALLDSPASPNTNHANPAVIVTNDFVPSLTPSANATITKMSRGLSQMDLASFSNRFGTLTMRGGRRGAGMGAGHKMLREESGIDLAGVLGEDEVF